MTGARLWALVAVTMCAFAANSILNRLAVDGGHIDALSFALVRVLAGAAMLSLLIVATGRRPALPPPRRLMSAAMLALYLLGFSTAYVHLDAGLGALILFGGVQLTMFCAGLVRGETIPARRWAGAALAFGGLALLVGPGAGGGSLVGAAAMLAAALGWGLYSVLGRGAEDPLPETAASFLIAVPMVWVPILLVPVSPEGGVPIDAAGWALAILSGAVTSGLGYALWYAILRRIETATAALVQLSAPLIAVAGGVVLLDEGVSLRLIVSAALILGGIAFGLWRPQRTIGSSGS
ncbi:EamA family transporter [Rhodobacterales bacterium HKCCE2091]|nr:EamA family transporter [Rhodobacterales bacterium HKCCE2091]